MPPGLIFGLIVGIALYRGRLLRPVGVAVFIGAATLFHIAAIFTLSQMEWYFGNYSPLVSYAVSGAVAGAIGGG